jgi:hypothetical protein
MKSSCHSLIPFLPFLLSRLRLPSPELDLVIDNISLNFWQKLTRDHAENIASIVGEACLLIRCLATDVLLMRTLASAGMCLPSRCIAMGLYVTIIIQTTSKQQ